MKCLLFYLFLVLLYHFTLCMIGREFEFLNDDPKSRLIMATHGEKSKEVTELSMKLYVPECVIVTYVRVVLSNVDYLPNVSYDKRANLVNITYDGLLDSSTLFQMFVKGISDNNCSPQKLKASGYDVEEPMAYQYVPDSAVKIPAKYIRYP